MGLSEENSMKSLIKFKNNIDLAMNYLLEGGTFQSPPSDYDNNNNTTVSSFNTVILNSEDESRS